MNINEKVIEIRNGLTIKRLDVDGKWPKSTWLQQRRAMIKLSEARRELLKVAPLKVPTHE